MNADELDALAALDQAATPGPWIVGPRRQDNTIRTEVRPNTIHVAAAQVGGEPDAALIAAMRNALPALIEYARACQESDFYSHLVKRTAERDALAAQVAAVEAPKATTVTEWGVRWHDVRRTSITLGTVRTRDPGDRPYASEADARRDCPPGAHVVTRSRTTYAEVATSWERVS